MKHYRERYQNGINVGLEKGSFSVFTKDNKLDYGAHHFSEEELVELLIQTSISIELYTNTDVITRSGNKINGIVLIAKNSE